MGGYCMTIFIIYTIGVILSLYLYLNFGVKKGVITMSDLCMIFVATVASWVGVIIYLFSYVDFDRIIIWKRKNR